ncbi:MAG: transcription elongation protein SprT [Flavobacteriaceae bacterium]|jgi:predicted SprT family Zn-dependent metalloprotease|nr:transcription elongation protein SprT [Flavobacteriaceae bacterium]
MGLQHKTDYSKLDPYISEKAIGYVEKWLQPYWFHLIIKNPRGTKLGDYRLPVKGAPHKITINAGMPQSLCFLTLTHEIAHLIAFDIYSPQISPHGREWKKVFSEMILTSLDVYEEELKILLKNYARNPKAGFYADKDLSEYFVRRQNPDILLLKDWEYKKLFKVNNKIFYKLERVKTRYICIEQKTGKKYLIRENTPITEVNYCNDKE